MIRVRPQWEKGEKPPYAFCESAMATANSRWHIRKVSEAGLKLGGGIDTPSLCNKVRPTGDRTEKIVGAGGWDLGVRITLGHLHTCCPECAIIYGQTNE
jgi:hypothetical protein